MATGRNSSGLRLEGLITVFAACSRFLRHMFADRGADLLDDGDRAQFVGPALGRSHHGFLRHIHGFCGICLRIAARISSIARSISASVRSLLSALLKSPSCVLTPSSTSVWVD